jgi:hypothetical protein
VTSGGRSVSWARDRELSPGAIQEATNGVRISTIHNPDGNVRNLTGAFGSRTDAGQMPACGVRPSALLRTAHEHASLREPEWNRHPVRSLHGDGVMSAIGPNFVS